MRDTYTTVVGNVATDPVLRTGREGRPFATFRLASTPRRKDRVTGEWVDGPTSFYGVRCSGNLAGNVMASVTKGQPVVVLARLRVNQWQSDDGPRTSVDLEVEAIGPDLTWGRASFTKVASVPPQAAAPLPGQVDAADGPAEEELEDDGAQEGVPDLAVAV